MSELQSAYAHRHPATKQLLRWFDSSHLPEPLQRTAQPIEALAYNMVDHLADGPELSAGLRKLLEAKDCFVREAVAASEGQEQA